MLSKFKANFNAKGEIYLRIKAKPGAAATEVKQIMRDQAGEIVKLDLAAPASRGQANAELIKFLAREFAIRRENVKIIAGAGDRLKLVKLVK